MAKRPGKQHPKGPTRKVRYDKEARRGKTPQAGQAAAPSARAVPGKRVPAVQGTTDSGLQSQSQKRAALALDRVRRLLDGLDGKGRKELKSHASALPAMIQTNGLGQAAAFYLSKGGRHQALYQILSAWLTGEDRPYARHNDLLDGITSGDLATYLAAQAEALALLDWVKRFANAFARED